MKLIENVKNKPLILILIVIPIFLILVNIHLSKISGSYSTRSFDPEYIYLLNGLTMGEPTLNVGHIDNPGTPLQVAFAISSRVRHLFLGKTNYFDDVLLNPDRYLRVVNLWLIIAVSILSVFLGYKTYHLTGSVLTALLIQITPFSSITVILNMTRILPDPFAWLSLIMLTYTIIKYYHDADSEERIKQYAITMGLICAFGLSFKFNAISYYILPLIILPGFRIKLWFFITGILSFFILAFPTLFDLNFVFFWLKGMLTHTGRYGSGAEGFIKTSDFLNNILLIFKFYTGYLYLLVLCAIAFIFNAIYNPEPDKKLQRILIAIVASMAFHVLIVAKHFAYHYMLPMIVIFPLVIYFSMLSLDIIWKPLKYYGVGIAILIVTGTFFVNYNSVISWKTTSANNKIEVINNITKLVNNNKLIIISQPYDAYFKEQGLVFGYFFTGKHRAKFSNALDKLYPNTYIYDLSKTFFKSGIEIPYKNVLKLGEEAFVFVDAQMIDKSRMILSLLSTNIQSEQVYLSDKTGDLLLKIKLIE